MHVFICSFVSLAENNNMEFIIVLVQNKNFTYTLKLPNMGHYVKSMKLSKLL